jgi:hypothetical protein
MQPKASIRTAKGGFIGCLFDAGVKAIFGDKPPHYT